MLIEVVLTILLVLIIWNSSKKPSNYPPGPWGLPIIGYVPFGRKALDQKLEELKKNYEKIFSWKIGKRVIVFITDSQYIKESFKSIDLSYRPQVEYLNFIIGQYDKGLLLPNGNYWQTLRRFTLRQMRDLGMGKSRLVASVHYEAAELVRHMRKDAGKQKPLSTDIRAAVINIIWQMIASKRFEFDDKLVLEYDDALTKFATHFDQILLVDIYPWMKSIFPKTILNFLTRRNHHENLTSVLEIYLKPVIDEHIKSLDVNNPRDYIDDFLIEMKKEKMDSGPQLTVKDLLVSLADIFGAAYQTTSSTIIWAIFYLAKFPVVQKRLQKEIDEIVPNGIQVSLEDKLRLPYTEAFIWELLRYSSLNRFDLPRTVRRDTKIGEYIVPKDSIIFGYTEALHFDPKLFESPNDFRPERFLNDVGKFEAPKDGYMPFGIGKRLCIGESLARMELLIFIVTLVQHLEFSVPDGESLSLQPINVTLLNMPKIDQNILISMRTES